MKSNNYKIYKYTNKLNGKVYIGRTKNTLASRAGHNGNKYLKLKHFGPAIKKYGWENFEAVILEDGLTYEECCKKEQEYIKYYDARNPQKGYNIAEGGEGPTKEALEKMRESHKEKHLSEEHKKHISQSLGQRENNVNFGRKQSPLAIQHNSEAKSGSNHPNWGKHLKDTTKEKIRQGNSKPCIQYDLEGCFIKEWLNAYEAEESTGIQGINNCLRYTRHTAGGFKWEFKEEEDRKRYQDNKYILENYGLNYIKHKEEILKRDGIIF